MLTTAQSRKVFERYFKPVQNTIETNIPFNRHEIKEHFSKSKTPLLNVYPNRRERRMSKEPVRQVSNNRKKTKARFSNTLLNKMSYYYLQINSRIGRTKYAKSL